MNINTLQQATELHPMMLRSLGHTGPWNKAKSLTLLRELPFFPAKNSLLLFLQVCYVFGCCRHLALPRLALYLIEPQLKPLFPAALVCMYVCMCVCTCVYVRVCMYICMYMFHVCKYAYMYAFMYMFQTALISLHSLVCLYVCIHACVYVHVCIYVWM